MDERLVAIVKIFLIQNSPQPLNLQPYLGVLELYLILLSLIEVHLQLAFRNSKMEHPRMWIGVNIECSVNKLLIYYLCFQSRNFLLQFC